MKLGNKFHKYTQTTKVWVLVAIMVFLTSAVRAESGNIEANITIRNGTTGLDGNADEVRVLEIGGMMKTLGTFPNAKSGIVIGNLSEKLNYLVQANWQNVRYFTLVSSKDMEEFVKSGKDGQMPVTVTVFDKREYTEQELAATEKGKVVFNPSFVTVRKEANGYSVLYTVEIVNNFTDRVVVLKDGLPLEFPGSVRESVRFSMSYDNLPMNAEVDPPGAFSEDRGNQPGKNSWKIKNPFKPGMSIVEASYQVSDEWVSIYYPRGAVRASIFLQPVDADIEEDAANNRYAMKQTEENTKENYIRYTADNVPVGAVFRYKITGGSFAQPEPNQKDNSGEVVTVFPIISDYGWIYFVITLAFAALLYYLIQRVLQKPVMSYTNLISEMAAIQRNIQNLQPLAKTHSKERKELEQLKERFRSIWTEAVLSQAGKK